MFDPTALSRTAILIALLVPVAACGNSPQQPSEGVDDRSAESPYLGGDAEGVDQSGVPPDSAPFANNETGSSTVPEPREMDSVATGAVVSDDALLAPFSGDWALDARDCGVRGPSLVSISRTQIERVGSQCQVANVIDGGDGSISVTLTCPEGAGGIGNSEIVKLASADDGNLQINIVGSEDPPQSLARCP